MKISPSFFGLAQNIKGERPGEGLGIPLLLQKFLLITGKLGSAESNTRKPLNLLIFYLIILALAVILSNTAYCLLISQADNPSGQI